jgi:hypothetical protein
LQVKEVPKQDYGKFYNGDSSIVLNVDMDGHTKYNAHVWIGKDSTPDEYGLAAYKMVELDTVLDGVVVQNCDVEGHESAEFLSYFNDDITILEGGIDSGFTRVDRGNYKQRLFHFHGDKNGVVRSEVPYTVEVDHSDVYVLEQGNTILVWRGKESNKNEGFDAVRYANVSTVQIRHIRTVFINPLALSIIHNTSSLIPYITPYPLSI